jgi:hypothetical protein
MIFIALRTWFVNRDCRRDACGTLRACVAARPVSCMYTRIHSAYVHKYIVIHTYVCFMYEYATRRCHGVLHVPLNANNERCAGAAG